MLRNHAVWSPLAAADRGRTSTASTMWGMAMAANMNTDGFVPELHWKVG
ncbi:hypothetical protein [Gordonia sp. (in: high G+C Gram-positive bacteria)]